ncbi:MAG: DUF6538 domain-containing protein [Thermodesulfobacteriota bacterium]
MKQNTNPSFLFLSRHGIYYFRSRIPLVLKKRYNTRKNEVRVSLRTGNKARAVCLARMMWVKCFENDYFLGGDTVAKFMDKYTLIMELGVMLSHLRKISKDHCEDGQSSKEWFAAQVTDYMNIVNISNLSDDVDILNEFFKNLKDDEIELFCEKDFYKRAKFITGYN